MHEIVDARVLSPMSPVSTMCAPLRPAARPSAGHPIFGMSVAYRKEIETKPHCKQSSAVECCVSWLLLQADIAQFPLPFVCFDVCVCVCMCSHSQDPGQKTIMSILAGTRDSVPDSDSDPVCVSVAVCGTQIICKRA